MNEAHLTDIYQDLLHSLSCPLSLLIVWNSHLFMNAYVCVFVCVGVAA